jgi:hypothetical protein
MSFSFDTWIRQPSTLHGLGVIAGGIGAALAHLTTGNAQVDMIVFGLSYALVHLGIDDNSVAQQSVTAVATDAINAATGKAVDATKALTDVLTAAQALKPLAPVVQGPANAPPPAPPPLRPVPPPNPPAVA